MNEQPTSPGADNPPEASSALPVEAASPASPPETSSRSAAKSGLPSWVPMAAMAVVPAVIVGLIVFFIAGGDSGGGGGSSVAVLDGIVRNLLAQGEDIDSYADRVPPGFPSDLPVFKGAELDGAFALKSANGTTFLVAYSSSASKSSVYDFYLARMDREPWQIEVSSEADDFTGMQFTRPDSADMQGSITISHSGLDGRTAIFVIILDASQTSKGSGGAGSNIPSASRSLPPGFPNDVPIYKKDQGTVIINTAFQRAAGQNAFFISFLTRDADVDVMNFYTKEFQKRGWNVKDAPVQSGDFALTIEFDDGKAAKEVQGTIRADVYAEDADYVEVSLIVQVSASRGRGN